MRLPPLAGLRFGDEALFKTGRAGMFGSDDTGPDRSLRWAIVKINVVNDTLITELAHQQWHGRISCLVKSPTRRPARR
ncbi:MAG: hypothetical protein LC749_22135 [Actinobacteria bacterium]|nr:hypothetical protein [Actinomycetota bacterium]